MLWNWLSSYSRIALPKFINLQRLRFNWRNKVHEISPEISTTDFYQAGISYNSPRFSFAASFFLIDRSNEQIYIPDDGSIEFARRSCSYGYELKAAARYNRYLSFNSELTRVLAAFYPREFSASIASHSRIQIDSAPHTIANASLIITELYGVNSLLNWWHIPIIASMAKTNQFAPPVMTL